jgi:hypothetical protein
MDEEPGRLVRGTKPNKNDTISKIPIRKKANEISNDQI